MKKYPNLAVLAVLTIIISIGAGCRKLIEYIDTHPISRSETEIIRFSFDGGGRLDTMRFTYNSWGDPVTGLRSFPGTGAPNFFFSYDDQHRLTELVGAYGDSRLSIGEMWHKYFYDAAGRIIVDSMYFFPDVLDGRLVPGAHGTNSRFVHEYDSRNRIIKVTWYQSAVGEPYITTYAYDGNGNLVGPAGYDNKVNFRRTNPIWAFLDRDYSMNNPIAARIIYNQLGLPTEIDCLPGQGERFLNVPSTSLAFQKAMIEYGHH